MRGTAVVGQSGGPTSVINASMCGVVKELLQSNIVDRVLGMRFGIEGFMEENLIDLGKQPASILSGIERAPGSALGSCRYKLRDEDLPRVLEVLKKHDIHYVFLIGGNDTMNTIARLEAYCRKEHYELVGVGVPKTVDNDLYGTDHTPGFPSAARYVALSVSQAGTLARDMQRVDSFVIHQTVGRDAGWLAASAALARADQTDPPHLIYVPERPMDPDAFIADCREMIDRHGFVSVVCGEGVVWKDGTPVSASGERDKFSNIEFGAMAGTSAAIVLHRMLAGKAKVRGEFQITESLSMCAIDRASAVDLAEAYRVGVEAVKLAAAGVTGKMVTIVREHGARYAIRTGAIDLQEVASRTKPMPAEFLDSSGNDVTEAFVDYMRPLVGPIEGPARLTDIPIGGTR